MSRLVICAGVLGATALLATAFSARGKDQSDHRVFELRTYYTNEGKMPDLHKRFRDVTLRKFKEHGITVIGFWEPQDAKDGHGDKLIYMVAFPNREAAKASWKAFGEDPEWRKAFEESHKNGVLVKKVDSVYMDPTDYSPIQ